MWKNRIRTHKDVTRTRRDGSQQGLWISETVDPSFQSEGSSIQTDTTQ